MSGSPTWGQHGQAFNGGECGPFSRAMPLSLCQESLTLATLGGTHPTGSGCVQPAVRITGASSVGLSHRDLGKQIKKAFCWWHGLSFRRRGKLHFSPKLYSHTGSSPRMEPLRETHSKCPSSEQRCLSPIGWGQLVLEKQIKTVFR